MKNQNDPMEQPTFDPATADALIASGAKALLGLLKKRRKAREVATAREFANVAIRSLEPILQQAFDNGLTIPEIIVVLENQFPNVTRSDLKYALNNMRDRQKRVRFHLSRLAPTNNEASQNVTATSAMGEKTSKATQPPADKSTAKTTAKYGLFERPEWADGSDKRADESDEDYFFRKEIEGPPEARLKFIGEQN